MNIMANHLSIESIVPRPGDPPAEDPMLPFGQARDFIRGIIEGVADAQDNEEVCAPYIPADNSTMLYDGYAKAETRFGLWVRTTISGLDSSRPTEARAALLGSPIVTLGYTSLAGQVEIDLANYGPRGFGRNYAHRVQGFVAASIHLKDTSCTGVNAPYVHYLPAPKGWCESIQSDGRPLDVLFNELPESAQQSFLDLYDEFAHRVQELPITQS